MILQLHFLCISQGSKAEQETFKKEFEVCKDRYYLAVSVLYNSPTYPPVFLWESLELVGAGGVNSNRKNSDQKSTACMQYNVPIKDIVEQLNHDFRVGVKPLEYTGRYRFVKQNVIQ